MEARGLSLDAGMGSEEGFEQRRREVYFLASGLGDVRQNRRRARPAAAEDSVWEWLGHLPSR
jgi:hypothetical protein